MGCCFLDEETFRLCCQLFLQHSDTIRDGWSWEQGLGSEEGYLRKATLGSGRTSTSSNLDQDHQVTSPSVDRQKPSRSRQDQEEPEQEQLFAAAATDDDDYDEEGVCCVSEGSSRVVQYEHHILYSCSYQTPVLYFRVSTLEGRSLSLEEVWDCVHPNYRQRLQHSPWDTITQQEHPLLGQPFFCLHPCRTEEFMRPVIQVALEEHRQVNYVVTWLSVVGPVVGLDVPLSYSTQVPAAPHTPVPESQPD